MDWMREIPQPLSRAQLSLEMVEGFAFLRTFRWNEQANKWKIKFRISLPELDADCSLKTSDWYLLVDESYPRGRIDIYPAKEGGIIDTYPHQSYNHEGYPDLPWRAGNICTNMQTKIIGRHGYDVEPYTVEERLLWHCQRAVEWVRCASKGELILPDEPFELPHIPLSAEIPDRFRFSEGPIDASPWPKIFASSGRARCFNLSTDENTWFFETLWGTKNQELFQVTWGQYVTHLRTKTWDGAWLRLPAMPLVKPYRFPETWGELMQAISEYGVSLRNNLRQITRHLRDGEIHFLLLGFPIPEICNGPAESMHWTAIALPILSRGKQYLNGFRPNEQGYFKNDLRTRFRNEERIIYIPTENWHPNQIQNRGRLQEGLQTSRVALIGCGALGAPIAEMLVRGGVHHMTLFDDDQIDIGNLARHTLSLTDVGNGKAAQLAQRLNSLNPHAEVTQIASKIGLDNEDVSNQLENYDIIVDCTGDDELLHTLADISLSHQVHFFSMSIGFRAKRMFFFHAKDAVFPVDNYFGEMSEWLRIEREEFEGETFPREGIGCFNPIFPARCDDMWLWASVGVKVLANIIGDPRSAKPVLHVYEQDEEEGGSISVHPAIQKPAYE